MKVETPQILWNEAEQDCSLGARKKSGKKEAINAALFSIDLVQSGLPDPRSHVMVTAGNASQVNVWHLLLPENPESNEKVLAPATSQNPNGGLEFRFPLGRERSGSSINCVKFSPNGLTLAVANDAASLQLYSVPCNMRGGGNGRHFWAHCKSQAELTQKVVSTGEGVTDISWSADSSRVLLASLDNSVYVVQRVTTTANDDQEQWQMIYRAVDHSHCVLGVAYDPLGVYLASMSNDRTVRLYPRKATAKTLKRVLKPVIGAHQALQHQQQNLQASEEAVRSVQSEHHASDEITHASEPLQASTKDNTSLVPAVSATITSEQAVQEWLANSKFEITKSRVIKYASRGNAAVVSSAVSQEESGTAKQPPRHCWFADEASLESFFRRLAWTADGHFLICPAALNEKPAPGQSPHACLVFSRHNFEDPHKILAGLQKPAVAIRPNHVRFELPPDELCKENGSNKAGGALKYRSIFAVLTWDAVLVYDTHHSEPLCILTGLHYANLTDAAWTADGHSLAVVSSDGYISLIRFMPGELGNPFPHAYSGSRNSGNIASSCPAVQLATAALTKVRVHEQRGSAAAILPPTEPGPVQLPAARPVKRAKLTHILPQKRPEQDGSASSEPNLLVPKKKKRIQPTQLLNSTMPTN